jgi:hypothetical protein
MADHEALEELRDRSLRSGAREHEDQWRQAVAAHLGRFHQVACLGDPVFVHGRVHDLEGGET